MQQELAILVQNELKDPRLGMVTIQAVRVARDYSHAKVYFTLLGGDLDEQETAKVLNGGASGYLRHCLSQRMRLRVVPNLHFVHDSSIETGAHLTDLIERAIENDNKNKS